MKLIGIKVFFLFIITFQLLLCCSKDISKENAEKQQLLQTIEDFENAWAAEDFLLVETFYAKNAKRFHTEPYVWDRNMIKDYFQQKAHQKDTITKRKIQHNSWKKNRTYLDIEIQDSIAYDAFTTNKFKALHIWKKQPNNTWKIVYDVGMLHHPCAD